MSDSRRACWPPMTRRDMLMRSGAGFGALALSYLLRDHPLFAQSPHNPAVPHRPHFPARAKSVIFLFMEGGPSHIDLFDPKPLLTRLAGQPIPSSFRPVITPMGDFYAPLLASRRRFAPHGQCGTWVSDWLPHTARCIDDIAVIRSCWGNGLNHSNGTSQMNTGSIVAGRPSLGAWVTYGLGSENENLPAFVVMQDNPATVTNGPRSWGAGFMPAAYQGVRLQTSGDPIPHLNPPAGVSTAQQQGRLDLLYQLNQQHAADRPQQNELEARIASYELAFRMQAQAPEAVDLSQETAETQALYGINERETESYGRLCLMGRRLVERGVRFVQLYHGAGNRWDAHRGIERNHSENCRSSDKPVAGLLRDLKRRGLLDDTLVIWGGEFGRTPMSEVRDVGGRDIGRNHHIEAFTVWM